MRYTGAQRAEGSDCLLEPRVEISTERKTNPPDKALCVWQNPASLLRVGGGGGGIALPLSSWQYSSPALSDSSKGPGGCGEGGSGTTARPARPRAHLHPQLFPDWEAAGAVARHSRSSPPRRAPSSHPVVSRGDDQGPSPCMAAWSWGVAPAPLHLCPAVVPCPRASASLRSPSTSQPHTEESHSSVGVCAPLTF